MVHGSGRTSADSDPIGRASEARASRGPCRLEEDHGRRAPRRAAIRCTFSPTASTRTPAAACDPRSCSSPAAPGSPS